MQDDAPDPKPSQAPDGVFGNLPAARPGTRSPRRRAGGKSNKGSQATPEPASKPAPQPSPLPPPPPEPPPGREPPPSPAPDPGQRIGSIEDLAWAGVAVAAQAATVGVRFASRALEAARKSADRRD